MAKKSIEDLKEEIRKIVSSITETPEGELKDDADFVKDLGVDSIMVMEIVASIEKKFKVIISEEEIPKVTSLEGIYELLEKLGKKK